jgi:hypothetical protein
MAWPEWRMQALVARKERTLHSNRLSDTAAHRSGYMQHSIPICGNGLIPFANGYPHRRIPDARMILRHPGHPESAISIPRWRLNPLHVWAHNPRLF